MNLPPCPAGPVNLHVEFPAGSEGLSVENSVEVLEKGLLLARFRFRSQIPCCFPKIEIHWMFPSVGVQGVWTPVSGHNKGLGVDWGQPFPSRSTSGSPVATLFSPEGRNRLTFAASEVLEAVKIHSGIHEETAEFFCGFTFFSEVSHPRDSWDLLLRIDLRDIPWFRSLKDVSLWWESLPGCEPSPVPMVAREPMLSTWYSFHQDFTPEQIESECRIAAEWGFRAVILDDGWQTMDTGRGYSHCGDWKPERIPDMRAFVDRLHSLGMKVLLWYSVPFVGFHSEAAETFAGKYLTSNPVKKTHVLDPRFPEVREFLIRTYVRALAQVSYERRGTRIKPRGSL